MDPLIRPKLRWPLELRRLEHQGQEYILFDDPQGIASQVLCLPAVLFPVVSRFDGAHTLLKIAQDLAGSGLTIEILLQIVAQFESTGLLETERTLNLLQVKIEQFLQSDVRQAFHAGAVYAETPENLRQELSSYIDGAQPRTGDHLVAGEKSDVAAIMSPHIDYRRGWRTYVASYRALEAAQRPDIIILIGTAHQAANGLFHLTRKHFATPLGRAVAARQEIDALAKIYGAQRSFAEEILHQREHSLELQLPFLLHLFGESEMPPIVPVLVGSFDKFFQSDKSPLEHADVADFVGGLSELLRKYTSSGRRVMFFAGVDLAHLGRYFGDEHLISDAHLEELERRDGLLLAALLAGDYRRVFAHMAEDRDSRRICGYPSLYTMLAALQMAGIRTSGVCLEYRQAVDEKRECIVSFASAFWRHG